MARPERNNIDYFPFYCEDGKKMFFLEETYGNDGFAVFIKLLRELAKTDFFKAIKDYNKDRIKFIAQQLEIINPFKEPEKIATIQGTINGLRDMIMGIEREVEARKKDLNK